jgi:SAM-dependent methyltransferase
LILIKFSKLFLVLKSEHINSYKFIYLKHSQVRVILMESEKVKKIVKERYSEIAKSKRSCCCSSSCCEPSTKNISKQIGYSQMELQEIPESSVLGLGCGNPVANADLKEGETVVDLGSGGGIDVFLASKKIGEKGKVIGVDMTEEMLKRAKTLALKNGYTNVEFRLGEIENLPIENEIVDVIISNCVINLSPNKIKVFKEAYRVLKPNGRLMVSDLVTLGELPENIKNNFDAWAGCIAGALEKSEYLNTIEKAGFKKVEIISEKAYTVNLAEELKGKIMSIQVKALK